MIGRYVPHQGLLTGVEVTSKFALGIADLCPGAGDACRASSCQEAFSLASCVAIDLYWDVGDWTRPHLRPNQGCIGEAPKTPSWLRRRNRPLLGAANSHVTAMSCSSGSGGVPLLVPRFLFGGREL